MPRVPGTFREPKGAPPFESCISCYRGDVSTALHLNGEPDWVVAGLCRFTGIDVPEAIKIYDVDPPEADANGRVSVAVRLCRECAAKTQAIVSEIASEGEYWYVQRL